MANLRRPLNHGPASSSRAGGWSRRAWLQSASAAALGGSLSGWLPALAARAAQDPNRRRACILLWMTGGPSQIDTLDPKPGHENGGPFQAIDTNVPGLQLAEHLPRLARMMDEIALVRSMSTKEGDHTRATYLLRTGYLPQGPVQFPTLGSLVANELGSPDAELPNFVSVSPFRFLSPGAFGPGFLGPRHAPLVVGGQQNYFGANPNDYEQALAVRNLAAPAGILSEQTDARLSLLQGFESDFSALNPSVVADSHRAAYEQAVRLMRSESVRAFRLDEESPQLRDRYGRNQFGQGCLLARRLVERGTPFVEVSLNGVAGNQGLGWDTHVNNFDNVRGMCQVLDPAWSCLLEDLKARGMLDSTLVVWMGEFGRTPRINGSQGRDHFPAAWSTALCGGGIRGGQAIGRTSADGMTVDDRPVSVADLLATVCQALGLDVKKQNMSNVGRPIRLVDPQANPIREALA